MTGCKVLNNSMTGNFALSLLNTQVSQNTAAENGGGIGLSGSGVALTVQGGEISNNKATQGGGINADSSSSVEVSNGCRIAQNNADFGGGLAVAGASTTVKLKNAQVLNNKATVASGGGMWIGSGTVDVESSAISFNSAEGPTFTDLSGGSSACQTRGGCIYSSNYPNGIFGLSRPP